MDPAILLRKTQDDRVVLPGEATRSSRITMGANAVQGYPIRQHRFSAD